MHSKCLKIEKKMIQRETKVLLALLRYKTFMTTCEAQ